MKKTYLGAEVDDTIPRMGNVHSSFIPKQDLSNRIAQLSHLRTMANTAGEKIGVKRIVAIGLLFSLGTAFQAIDDQCDPLLKDKIFSAQPLQLLAIVHDACINAFHINFTHKRFDSDKLLYWNNVKSCCNQYVLQRVTEKQAPAIYREFINDINICSTYIASLFYAGNLYRLTQSDLQAIAQRLKVMQFIATFCLRTITKEVNLPLHEFRKTVPLKDVIPDYHSFFREYGRVLKDVGNSGINEERLEQFLQAHGFGTIAALEQLVDALEQFMYHMQHEINQRWFGSHKKNSELMGMAQQLVQSIKNNNPSLLSALDKTKVAITQDKSSLLLCAQALSLRNILMNVSAYIQEGMLQES